MDKELISNRLFEELKGPARMIALEFVEGEDSEVKDAMVDLLTTMLIREGGLAMLGLILRITAAAERMASVLSEDLPQA